MQAWVWAAEVADRVKMIDSRSAVITFEGQVTGRLFFYQNPIPEENENRQVSRWIGKLWLSQNIAVSSAEVGDSDIQSTQIWYYRMLMLREERFSIFGRLANEYIVDMWTREIETWLYYYKMNSERRLEQDRELMAEEGSDTFLREDVYLPANFIGSLSWASDNVRVYLLY